MNRLREILAGLSLVQKLEYGGGLLVAVAVASIVFPLIGILLVLLILAMPLSALLRGRLLGVGGISQRARAWILRAALVLGGLTLLGLMFASASGQVIALLAIVVAAIVGRAIQIQRRKNARRRLPNRRQAIKTSHSPDEADSEALFREFWHLVAAGNAGDEDEPRNGKAARTDGQGVISGVLIFSRPDEHGAVLAESFIEGHEDTHPAEILEHATQSVFAGDLTIYPVEQESYPPVAEVEKWQASNGADPDHDYDVDEIENLAPPPRDV